MGNIFSSGKDVPLNAAFTVRLENARKIKKELQTVRKSFVKSKESLVQTAEAHGETFYLLSSVASKMIQPGLRCVNQFQDTTRLDHHHPDAGSRDDIIVDTVGGVTELADHPSDDEKPSSSGITSKGTGLTLQQLTQANTILVHTQRLAGHTMPFTDGEEFKRLNELAQKDVSSVIDSMEGKWATVMDKASRVTEAYKEYNRQHQLVERKEASYRKKGKALNSVKMTGYRESETRFFEAYERCLERFDAAYEEALGSSMTCFAGLYVRWMLGMSRYLSGMVEELALAVAADDEVPAVRLPGEETLPLRSLPAPGTLRMDSSMVTALSRLRCTYQSQESEDGVGDRCGRGPVPSWYPSGATHLQRASDGGEHRGDSPDPRQVIRKQKPIGVDRSAAPKPSGEAGFVFDPVAKPPQVRQPEPESFVRTDPFSLRVPESSASLRAARRPIGATAPLDSPFALRNDEELSLPPTTRAN